MTKFIIHLTKVEPTVAEIEYSVFDYHYNEGHIIGAGEDAEVFIPLDRWDIIEIENTTEKK